MKTATCTINFYSDFADYDKAFQCDYESYDFIERLINDIFTDEAEFERRCFAWFGQYSLFQS